MMLSRHIKTAKVALKVNRYRSRSLDEAVAKVKESADLDAVARLRRKMAPVVQKDPSSAAKYATPRYWFLLNKLRAAELGLQTASGLRILDIGCGPGYFIAIGRALGHQCFGVDAPDSCLNAIEREVYGAMIDALGCRGVVTPLLIERFKPLPFHEQPFDLITAFWICFNRHRQADEWGLNEWKFFVEDARACLRPGGRLVLDLNDNSERYGTLRFYDEQTRNYFRSVGSVDQGRITIARG